MARKLIKEAEKEKRHNHIYQVDFEDVNAFVRDLLSLRNETSIEILDCDKSFLRRKRDDISLIDALDQILECKFKSFSFILRKFCVPNSLGDRYFEFCASGRDGSVENFVWIEVEEGSGFKLVEKYKLKKNDE